MRHAADDEVWLEYRRAKREWILLWLAWVPVGAVVAAIFGMNSLVMGLFVVVYVSRFLWVQRIWQRFLCPRCEKPFISGRGWSGVHDLFPDRACKHCGFPEYGPLPPVSLADLQSLPRSDGD